MHDGTGSGSPPPIVGEHPEIVAIRQLVARIAATDSAVLITGPAGSGKKLVARHIHNASPRRDRPLIRVALHRLPQGQPAERLREAAAAARGSTLLLDGIEALAPDDYHLIEEALWDDVRIISTTRHTASDLARGALGVTGLFYRIGTVVASLPPLSARGSDVERLAEHYGKLFARRYGREHMLFDQEACVLLGALPWEGGIQQLIQIVERSVAVEQPLAELLSRELTPQGTPANPSESSLERSERRMVELALERNRHNVTKAARELGLTRTALYRRLAKYGL